MSAPTLCPGMLARLSRVYAQGTQMLRHDATIHGSGRGRLDPGDAVLIVSVRPVPPGQDVSHLVLVAGPHGVGWLWHSWLERA